MSIYQRFCREILDESGNLKKIHLEYPEDFNFAYDVVDQIAAETPEKRALVWCNTENEEKIFSFADLQQQSNKAANVFQRSGLKRGDRVMVILKRHYEYWIVALALHKLGVTMIPATHMLTVHDLVYRLEASGADAVVCTPQNNVPEKIREALAEIAIKAGEPAASVHSCEPGTADMPAHVDCKLWTVREDIEGFENLTRQMEAASIHFERRETLATDPMLLYFTSGTTGNPKGVIHDFSYPLAHIVTAKYWHQAEDGGLHFTVAETGWAKASWGKIYGQWLVGSAVMVYDFDNFDPKQLTTVINNYGVTSFCAPPTVYRYLVRKGMPDMPTLKHASTAGEQLAPEVFRRFYEKTGIPLCEGYGQTETTLLMANFKGHEPVSGAMGTVSPMYDIELRDKNGNPVQPGEIGEVVILPPESGQESQPENGQKTALLPGIFRSYLDNEEQYEYVWRGGVYHTGDAAWQDENGLFWFHGRFDDIIKTGGYRVGPYEVEHVLIEHPAVMECSVIGVPDPARGQAIKAVVVPAPGYECSKELEKEIKMFCNNRLAEYKWIRILEFAEELPKTISGKIRKTELRAI